MSNAEKRNKIVSTLKGKTLVKKQVFEQTKEIFASLKQILHNVAAELQDEVKDTNPMLEVKANDCGQYEIRLRIAGDTIVFMMHSNVFDFERSHKVHKSSYVKENEGSSYCGVIMIYNFLSDSFKYNRVNDVGYLVGRVFINKDKHYFVEGKKEMGFLFNDFHKSVINDNDLENIVEAVIDYCLDFDLYTPPYREVEQVSVFEMKEVSRNMTIKTAKRLGFKFSSESDISGKK